MVHGKYVAPRTPVEEVLTSIWAEVLKLDRVGVHDDFFELGGHSLIAARIIARVRDSFAIDLPVRALLEATTVSRLAERLEAALREEHGLPLPPLVAQARTGWVAAVVRARAAVVPGTAGERGRYNLPLRFHFEGVLDLPRFERQLQ